jgi:hypothetical protein
MNKQRRNALSAIEKKIDELVSELYDIKDEEQDAFDNLPEGLQMSERGDLMQENIDNLHSIIADL